MKLCNYYGVKIGLKLFDLINKYKYYVFLSCNKLALEDTICASPQFLGFVEAQIGIFFLIFIFLTSALQARRLIFYAKISQ